jgi:hypothetical protein
MADLFWRIRRVEKRGFYQNKNLDRRCIQPIIAWD